jgi:AAA ATPase-like protein
MKLVGFQVQMYRCVLDSTWIPVTPLTVVVGKNESGKTAILKALQILKALHKFNPFKPEPYHEREWPRGRRDSQSKDQIVCTAEFELSAEEEIEILGLTNTPAPLRKLKVTKDYSGKFEVLFPPEVFPNKLHPNEVDRICGSLPESVQPTGADFLDQVRTCREEALRLAHEGRFTELATIPESHGARLQAVVSPNGQQPQHQNEIRSFVAAFPPR